MHRSQVLLILLASTALGADFSGTAALEFARKVVSFGPRPVKSEAHAKTEAYIHAELKQDGCQIIDDTFNGRTPVGPIKMTNIIARFPGTSGQAVVFTGHYDSKLFPGRNFVAANDGGSSTAFLLEMGRVMAKEPHKDDVYLVFFDGEEAIGEWSETDGIHGSRHLAEKWAADGTLTRVKALISVDMIGDKDLGILQELNSSPNLLRLVWQVAREKGYGKYFLDSGSHVEDDHIPFLHRGVNALDLIDFDYGPDNAYWHTDQDTMDKISAHSLEVVGAVLMEVFRRMQQ